MLVNAWISMLPVAGLFGWYVGRTNSSRDTDNPNNSPLARDYFTGLNYLLNEEPDKAVDVFIKVLDVDNNTVETHQALGNLFRRRGEVARAIRIHQNIIARPNLGSEQRVQALLALGRDYMSAGVFDRAERLFLEVVDMGGAQTINGLRSLLDIYQQERSWEQAISIAQRLENAGDESKHIEISHYLCELAIQARNKSSNELCRKYLKRALSINKNCVRASMLLAELEMQEGRYKAALKSFKRAQQQDPDFIHEMIEPLIQCYEHLGNESDLLDYLKNSLDDYPSASVALSVAQRIRQQFGNEAAIDFLIDQLRKYPSLRGLRCLIQLHLDGIEGKVKEKLEVLKDLTDKLLESKPIYRCSSCGFAGKAMRWFCPGCKSWGHVKPIHGLEGD